MWLTTGFIKGVGLQLLLCATETLVWNLIGSDRFMVYGFLCVFLVTSFKWLFACDCVWFVCMCMLDGYCRLLQALMIFAECEALSIHMLIKIATLQ